MAVAFLAATSVVRLLGLGHGGGLLLLPLPGANLVVRRFFTVVTPLLSGGRALTAAPGGGRPGTISSTTAGLESDGLLFGGLGFGGFLLLGLGGGLTALEESSFWSDDLVALDAPWVTVDFALVAVDFGSLPVFAGVLLPPPSAFSSISRDDLRQTVTVLSEPDLVGGSPSKSAMAGGSSGSTSTSFGVCGCMLA